MATHPRFANKTHKGILLLLFLLAFALLFSACGGGSQANTSTKQTVLVINANTGGDYTRIFNRYSSSTNYGSQGLVYETLLFYNRLNGTVRPWLASSYNVSSDSQTMTFQMRPDVKWSDGQPFNSADVLFTLNLLKKYPAMDVNSMWQYIKSVTAPDASTIVVTLNTPYSPLLWFLGGQTWILPRHHYTKVGDLSQYADPNPIGTGSYLLKTFTPQNYFMVKNPHYWQPGKPAVNEIDFPAYDSNTSAAPDPDRMGNGEKAKVPARGEIPSLIKPPSGCRFHPRCHFAMPVCRERFPKRTDSGGGHWTNCFLYGDGEREMGSSSSP